MSTKTLQSLDLAIAQKQVRDLSDALARISHQDACQECQYRLQEAVEAYRWITRAEESIRQGVYYGLIECTPHLDEAMQALYRDWVDSSEQTEKLVAHHTECGGEPLDVREFLEVSSLAREKVNSMAWVRKSRKFRSQPTHEAAES